MHLTAFQRILLRSHLKLSNMSPVPKKEQRRSLKWRRDQLKRYRPQTPSPLRIARSCSTAADEDNSQQLRLPTDSLGRLKGVTPVPSDSDTDCDYDFEEIWPGPESSRHSLQVNAGERAYSHAPTESVDKEQKARNDRASHCEHRPGMPDFDKSSWSVRGATQPSCKCHSDSSATLPSDESAWPMKQTREVAGEVSAVQPSTEQKCGDGTTVGERVLLLQAYLRDT